MAAPVPAAISSLTAGALSPQAIAYYQALEKQQNIQNAGLVNGIPLDAQGLIRGLPSDIQAIFADAANAAAEGHPWTTDVFQGKLVQTNWWRSTPESARTFLWTSVIDPAQAQQQGNQQTVAILQQAEQMGRPISMAQAADIAHRSILGNWNAAQTQQYLATAPLGAGQTFGPGNVETETANVRKTAADYGMNISPATANDWGMKIAGGLTNQAGFEDYARNQAAVTHPYWAKQLSEGLNVRTLADPYIQQASKLLEVSPDSIDLSDPKWSFVQRDKNGATIPMSQTDWSTKLMTDPKYGWDRTDNAKQSAFQVVDQLQQTMGAK